MKSTLSRLREIKRHRRNKRTARRSLILFSTYVKRIDKKAKKGKRYHLVTEGNFLHIIPDEKIKIWKELEKENKHIKVSYSGSKNKT